MVTHYINPSSASRHTTSIHRLGIFYGMRRQRQSDRDEFQTFMPLPQGSVVRYEDTRIKKFVRGSYKLQTTYSTSLSPAVEGPPSTRHARVHRCPPRAIPCEHPRPGSRLSRCDRSAFLRKSSQSLGVRGIGENCSVLRSLIRAERLKFKSTYLWLSRCDVCVG